MGHEVRGKAYVSVQGSCAGAGGRLGVIEGGEPEKIIRFENLTIRIREIGIKGPSMSQIFENAWFFNGTRSEWGCQPKKNTWCMKLARRCRI